MKKNTLFILIGLTISLAVTIILPFFSLSIANSIIIGILLSIITIQLDILIQLREKSEITKQIDEIFMNLSEPSWSFTLMRNLSNEIFKILKEVNHSFFIESTKDTLNNCLSNLQKVSSGRIETNFLDLEPILEATKLTKEILLATSVQSVDNNFWMSNMGQKYFELNKQLALKGIIVKRIFIYDNLDDPLKNIMALQAKNKIEVYYTPAKSINSIDCRDFIIFDDNLFYEAELNANAVPIKNIFSINFAEIKNKQKTFNNILGLVDTFRYEIR